MIEVHYAKDRGVTKEDWLTSYHSFSFNDWYDAKKMNFGVLRVLNDDIIAPGRGFGLHAHANMEIVTIVLNGQLEHKDSTGGHGIIKAGDVQRMSAGAGVRHSEFNASDEPVHLLQIWLTPKEQNIVPSYEQQSFHLTKNMFTTIVDGTQGRKVGDALYMHQNAKFSIGEFKKDQEISHTFEKNTKLYIFIISGSIQIGNNTFEKRDAAAITSTDKVKFFAREESKVLVIQAP